MNRRGKNSRFFSSNNSHLAAWAFSFRLFPTREGGQSFLPTLKSPSPVAVPGLCSELVHGCRGCLNAAQHSCTWAKGSALLGRAWLWIQTSSSGFALVQCSSEQTLNAVRKNSSFTALISQDLGDALVSSEASSKGTKLQKKQVLDCLCCEAFHFHPTRPIYSQYLWHASNLKVNGLGSFHKNAEMMKFQHDIMLFHICGLFFSAIILNIFTFVRQRLMTCFGQTQNTGLIQNSKTKLYSVSYNWHRQDNLSSKKNHKSCFLF